MEQSSTPWRVFDAPTAGAPAAVPGAAPSDAHGSQPPNRLLALAGVAGAIAIGGLALLLATEGAGGGSSDGPAPIAAASDMHDPLGSLPVGGQVVVDVAGAVVKPGVYRLAVGSRISDAIRAAGGFSPRVDARRAGTELNLAALLKDGEQIRVPSRDDSAATSGAGSTGGAGGGAGGASAGAAVNINTATQAELEALPGIGAVTAGKIIESRAQSPFKTVDELRARGLVGQKTFDKIRALLTVG